MKNKTKIMGILNLTSDSFSDAGSYVDINNAKKHIDEMIENNGIKLLVNKKSFLYLVGTVLEFSDGLNGKGFVFNNPNANRTCGCGESFSL